jgi:putative membrane protein
VQRASKLFGGEQRGRIEQAVIDAESKTSCEIVPVVATASGRYDRAEDIIGLWLVIASVAALWCWYPRSSVESGSWDGPSLAVELVVLVAVIVAAFIIGVVAGSRVGWLRRLFTPRREMSDEVAARARQVFFDRRVHHTGAGNGLLVYVSLFEHIAVVLGDQTIVDTLGQPFLDELCAKLTSELHAGDPVKAITSTIVTAGARLADAWPRAGDDTNELYDTLVIID